MERIAEDANLLEKVRQYLNRHAELRARVVSGKENEGEKFKDYFEHDEPMSKVPSHRALAMLRGRNEGYLQLSVNADPANEEGARESYCETLIAEHYGIHLSQAPADAWRKQVISWAWRIKVSMHMETELMGALKERAEVDAITVFATNLKDLLMAAPAGPKATLGLDPGLRTGCKVAVVDATGKVLATDTIYPHAPQKQYDKAAHVVEQLVRRFNVDLIAIGNGTASRETDSFAADVIKHGNLSVQKIIVSEAGASVYSASELAAKEFPNMDVSLRGAVSIARRLQDPLAELVKIDPKSIGVGQYQHDVSQTMLAKRLDAVVEDCVNAVGVDVNTASAALLTRVAGLSSTLAQNIVDYRDENGRFEARTTLKKVARLGPKAFEQCAGFLRIMDGKNRLMPHQCTQKRTLWLKQLLKRQVARSSLSLVIQRFFEPLMRSITPMTHSVYQPSQTSSASLISLVVTRAQSSKRQPSRKASTLSMISNRAWYWKAWSLTSQISVPLSILVFTKMVWSTFQRLPISLLPIHAKW
ncbi:transcription accessory protein [Vibrio maritimus]|uniref:Transcription accessory protein n=1 Tax=Vibrio maritimus TaxID=990268 RepID=A0A090S6M0_9VIBR|nr:transcription accessory protein [Vibrio maritimus]